MTRRSTCHPPSSCEASCSMSWRARGAWRVCACSHGAFGAEGRQGDARESASRIYVCATKRRAHVCVGMCAACGTWHVACGIWHAARGTWHVACGTWHVACGMWHVWVACGMRHVACGTCALQHPPHALHSRAPSCMHADAGAAHAARRALAPHVEMTACGRRRSLRPQAVEQ